MAEVSRRDFLKLAAGTFSALAAGGLSSCDNPPPSKLGPQPFPQVLPTPLSEIPTSVKKEVLPDLLRLTTENAKYRNEIIQSAQRIMALEVPKKDSVNERTNLEVNMFMKLQTKNASASDILLALQVAGTIGGRGWGMEMLWKQRQEGKLLEYGIKPLDNKEIEWAIANKIDPRTLAISIDTRRAVCDLLEAGRDFFFEAVPGLERAGIKSEETLPNPGVMAQLMMSETGSRNSAEGIKAINRFWGYVFIGGSSAWKKLNLKPDYFPKGQVHLMEIATILQGQTGLPYRDFVEYIPGSDSGALGTQFMPINALLFMNWYNEANKILDNKYPAANPFDPFTGTIMCYLFLASEFYGRHGDITDKLEIVRPGYRVSKTDKEIKLVYLKWNGDEDQVNSAIAAGKDYQLNVGRM